MSATDPLDPLVDEIVVAASARMVAMLKGPHDAYLRTAESLDAARARLSAVLAAARAVDATHGHGGSVIDAAVALAGALRALRDALAAADGAA